MRVEDRGHSALVSETVVGVPAAYRESFRVFTFRTLLHDPASWLIYLLPKQDSLLSEYFQKNLSLYQEESLGD